MVDGLPAPVVQGDAAGMRGLQHLVAQRGIVAEAIQRQRARPGVDVTHGVFKLVIWEHRQHGAKDFLLHQPHVGRQARDDLQRHAPPRPRLRAGLDLRAFGARVLQQRVDAGGLAVVDDGGVVGRRGQVGAKHFDEAGFGLRHEIGHALARHQGVVGCHADLARIGALAVGDGARRLGHRVAARHQRGRFAAQLQRDRRQVVGGGAHDHAAHGGRAREHDVIERQRGEVVGVDQLFAHHGHLVFGKHLRQHAAQHRVGRGRDLGHLDHHAVARRQRRREWPQRQVHGEVPRHDHADHALGLVGDAQAVGGKQQLRPAAARAHPAAEVREGVVDLQRGAQHIQHLGFGVRAKPEVGADRLRQRVLVAQQLALELAQRRLSRLGRRIGVLRVRGRLRGEHFLQARGGLKGRRCRSVVVHKMLALFDLAAVLGGQFASRHGAWGGEIAPAWGKKTPSTPTFRENPHAPEPDHF